MKTNRIKINIDRDPVSSEEISNMMDFGQVLKKSGSHGPEGNGKWKPALYIGGAAILALLGWGVSRFVSDNSLQVEQINQGTTVSQEGLDVKAKAPFVNPPVKEWDIPYTTYEIDAGKGGSFTHYTGSRIEVPAQCLLDEGGNTVSGNVEFRYREFHDGLDFALSGIPMTYDSAGTRYTFESGGMCEILAFQDNKPLSVKPGAAIKMDMVSRQEGIYNLYQLDTTAKNWVNKGNTSGEKGMVQEQPPVAVISEIKSDDVRVDDNIVAHIPDPELQKLETEIREIRKEKPLEPVKANPKRPRFSLNIEEKDYPELAGFKKMLFEVAEEDKSFKPEYYKIVWTNIRLERYQDIKYKMILERDITKTVNGVTTPTGKTEKAELIVYPVFDEKDYPAALNKYEEMLGDYNKKLDSRLKREEQLRKDAEEKRRKAEEKFKKDMEEGEKRAEENRKKGEEEWKRKAEEQKQWARKNFAAASYGEIRRVFYADNFGIWNSDNPVTIKKPSEKILSFADMQEQKLSVGIVYQLVNDNTLMCNYFHKCCNNVIKYNKNDKNVLFTILADGRVAFQKTNEWTDGSGNQVLKMEVSPKKFETAEEVREFLGI